MIYIHAYIYACMYIIDEYINMGVCSNIVCFHISVYVNYYCWFASNLIICPDLSHDVFFSNLY